MGKKEKGFTVHFSPYTVAMGAMAEELLHYKLNLPGGFAARRVYVHADAVHAKLLREMQRRAVPAEHVADSVRCAAVNQAPRFARSPPFGPEGIIANPVWRRKMCALRRFDSDTEIRDTRCLIK